MNELSFKAKSDKLLEVCPHFDIFKLNEAGSAELFSELYQYEVHYCPELDSWLIYNGVVWAKDIKNVNMIAKMTEFSNILLSYFDSINDDEKKTKFKKYALSVGNATKMDKILKIARSSLQISISELDSNPYLINCTNGTYDLLADTLKPHNPDDYITMCTGYRYEDINSEQWVDFINQVCEYNTEKVNYLHKALGYSILGLANEECMFILWGSTTRNGKSTLLNTIKLILGDYAAVASVKLICKSKIPADVNAASPTLARLKDTRFVSMSETSTTAKLSEDTIKLLTGGEQIVSRELYKADVSYTPQFTLWMSCNDLPLVDDITVFTSGRIRVIEFTRHFSDSEQNKNLKSELTNSTNAPGILKWLIDGYRLYTQEGLTMPDFMQSVIDDYKTDNDVVGAFLSEMCERTDVNDYIRTGDLYIAYSKWAERNRRTAMSNVTFGRELKKHKDWYLGNGLDDGYTTYKGLTLKKQ